MRRRKCLTPRGGWNTGLVGRGLECCFFAPRKPLFSWIWNKTNQINKCSTTEKTRTKKKRRMQSIKKLKIQYRGQHLTRTHKRTKKSTSNLACTIIHYQIYSYQPDPTSTAPRRRCKRRSLVLSRRGVAKRSNPRGCNSVMTSAQPLTNSQTVNLWWLDKETITAKSPR